MSIISQTLNKILDGEGLDGCSDGNCFIRKNRGQVTNGGCRCLDKCGTITSRDIRLYVKILSKYIEDLEMRLGVK